MSVSRETHQVSWKSEGVKLEIVLFHLEQCVLLVENYSYANCQQDSTPTIQCRHCGLFSVTYGRHDPWIRMNDFYL